MGDQLYGATGEARYPELAANMDAAPLAFVTFGGDFKDGVSLCDDATFEDRLARFNASRHPFIFLPGDNEWTDCWREGDYDPIERLDKLRQLFAAGEDSLGQRTLRLTRQSSMPAYQKYRENVRWAHGGVMFVGLNVQGSNNNLGRTPEQDAEFAERDEANIVWLRDSFQAARAANSVAIMVIWQANPMFLDSDPFMGVIPADVRTATRSRFSGFSDIKAALAEEVQTFDRPVVLAHGDTHYFRIDKPMRDAAGVTVPNFTRVEWYGERDLGWLEATVDPSDPDVFSFRPILVP